MMSTPNLSSSSPPTHDDDPQTEPHHDWLLSWVPSESPQRWLGINAVAALYSFILALVLVFVADDEDEGGGGPKEMMLAKHSYLIYDWILSFVWVLEITLTVWYSYIWKNNNKPQEDSSSSSRFSPSVWHILELLVAVYFAMSSIYFLERQWDDPNIHDMTDMFVDIMINIVAYGYMTFEVWKTWKQQQQNDEPGGHNNHSSSVNDGYTLATDDSKRRYGSLSTDGPAEGRLGDGELV